MVLSGFEAIRHLSQVLSSILKYISGRYQACLVDSIPMASSPLTQVYVFQDFQQGTPGLKLGGESWSYGGGDYYAGESCLGPGANHTSLQYSFIGSEIRLFGEIGERLVVVTNSIDGSPTHTTALGERDWAFQQLYQSPVLSPQNHTVSHGELVTGNGLCYDFMLIVPGPTTPLGGQTLFVDDYYSSIQYAGAWEANTAIWPLLQGSYDLVSIMNTTHSTSTVGAGLTFTYTGTQLSLYGSFLWQRLGKLTFTYSIDGGNSLERSLSSNGTTEQHPDLVQPNFELLNTGPLPAGNHTITLTLTACVNQTLIVDYMLYTPSFDTLGTMPNLTQPSSVPTSGGFSTPASPSQTSLNATGAVPGQNTGAIAGGVVGGVVVLIIIAGFVYWYFKRKGRSGGTGSSHDRAGMFSVDPYTSIPTTPPPMAQKSLTGSSPSGHLPFRSPSPSSPPGPPAASAHGSYSNGHVANDNAQGIVQRFDQISEQVQQLQQRGDPGNVDVDGFTRSFNELSRQVQQLRSLVVPPSYVNTDV